MCSTVKKRLVVIGEYFPPRLGGGRRLFEILRKLSWKYDIRLIVIPPAYISFIRQITTAGEKEEVILCERMVGYRIGLPRFLTLLWKKSFVLPYVLVMSYYFPVIINKLAQLEPDLVIIDAPSPYSGLLGALSCKILGKKYVIEYNDIQALYAIEMLEKRINTITENALKFVEHEIIRNGWKATAISEFVGKYAIHQHNRKDIVVITNGADLELFDPKTNGDSVRSEFNVDAKTTLCVYTGRIEKCVGAETIIETAKLLSERSNIKFMIVGEGDSGLTSQLSELKNVILTGLVPREQVPEYLAAADIVLVPLSDSIASHGISPLKLFESMAMRKAVLASAVSGVKEIVTDNYDGILVSGGSEQWAQAITDLIENPSNASYLATNALKTAQKYSWNRLAERFDELITDIGN